MKTRTAFCALTSAALLLARAFAGQDDPARVLAALDTAYQQAVERNDWQAMDRILHPDFTLVLGNGTVITRAELIASAHDRQVVYDKQEELPGTQTVRVFGKDTATVTACLWIKYTRGSDHSLQDYKLWFTDTYVRTHDGWRYAFGQASLHLPQ
jgi:ketosteroid isomerase-like protein